MQNRECSGPLGVTMELTPLDDVSGIEIDNLSTV
jgi:hypothetical protein